MSLGNPDVQDRNKKAHLCTGSWGSNFTSASLTLHDWIIHSVLHLLERSAVSTWRFVRSLCLHLGLTSSMLCSHAPQRWAVIQSVLFRGQFWGSWPDFCLCEDGYSFVTVRHPLWREDGSVSCHSSRLATKVNHIYYFTWYNTHSPSPIKSLSYTYMHSIYNFTYTATFSFYVYICTIYARHVSPGFVQQITPYYTLFCVAHSTTAA
jgi:hypothetical protein